MSQGGWLIIQVQYTFITFWTDFFKGSLQDKKMHKNKDGFGSPKALLGLVNQWVP